VAKTAGAGCFSLHFLLMSNFLFNEILIMSRKETIDAIASTSGITKEQAKTALQNIEGLIASSLVESGEYQLVGVGTLKVKQRAERTGRNPKTGEPIEIAASKAVTFSVAKAMKTALNS
jgi:DNA-binding protein HU-beta